MNKVLVIILEAIEITIAIAALPFAINKGEGFWIITNIVFIILSVIGLFVTIFYPQKSQTREMPEGPYDNLSAEQMEMIKQANEKARNNY